MNPSRREVLVNTGALMGAGIASAALTEVPTLGEPASGLRQAAPFGYCLLQHEHGPRQ